LPERLSAKYELPDWQNHIFAGAAVRLVMKCPLTEGVILHQNMEVKTMILPASIAG
jgi:hypothetical protein